MKKIVLLAFVLVLLSTAMIVSIRPVVAEETIYIKSDGSVEGTDKIQRDGNIYTFTDNIVNQSIVVERDNIVVDGAGCTLQGTGSGKGIDLTGRSNVTIKNVEIKAFKCGICLHTSPNNTIYGNTIIGTGFLSSGVRLAASSNNTVSANNITNNYIGVHVSYSFNNTVSGNNITNNDYGIYLYQSSDNMIFHNSFINNTIQVEYPGIDTTWDGGYPSGGNYWSDHVCAGNPSDGSQPYIIDANNIDHYPFQDPNGWINTLTIYSSPTGVTFTVDGVSRTTPWSGTYTEGTSVSLVMPESDDGYVWSHWLEDGDPNRTKTVTMDTNITLTAVFTDTTKPSIGDVSQEPEVPDDGEKVMVTVDVTDEESGVRNVVISYSTDGGENWNNVTIAKTIGNTYEGEIPGLPAETNVQYKVIAYDNAGNFKVNDQLGQYFVYTVIPEFPTWTSMLLILIVLTLAVAIYKRKLLKKPIH